MEPALSTIRAIFFDVDGTLSNSDDQMMEQIIAHLHFFLPSQKDAAESKFARYIVAFAMASFNKIFHLVDKLGLDNLYMKLFSHRTAQKKNGKEKEFILINGTRTMLERLSAHYPLGIISTRSETYVAKFLHQFSLEKFFQVIVSEQTCYYTKPFPQPLLYAAEKVHQQAKNCLMVGDTMVDIMAGKAAGMKTVAVLSGFGTLKELRKAAPDFILSSPIELVSLLGLSADK